MKRLLWFVLKQATDTFQITNYELIIKNEKPMTIDVLLKKKEGRFYWLCYLPEAATIELKEIKVGGKIDGFIESQKSYRSTLFTCRSARSFFKKYCKQQHVIKFGETIY